MTGCNAGSPTHALIMVPAIRAMKNGLMIRDDPRLISPKFLFEGYRRSHFRRGRFKPRTGQGQGGKHRIALDTLMPWLLTDLEERP
jgi:hypothetical protein